MAVEIKVKTTGADAAKGLGDRITSELDKAGKIGIEKARNVVLRRSVERVSYVSDIPHPRFLRVRTGALRSSLVAGSSKPPTKEGDEWSAIVGVAEGVSAVYAEVHELSSRSYLLSSLKEKKREVVKIVRDEVNAALKRTKR